MSENKDTPEGFAFAVTAYVLWGFLPLYLKLLSHIPAAEVIVHRVLWSIPIAALVLIVLRRTSDLVQALRSPRILSMGLLTAGLISINWGVYVWAISAEHTLDAALGYYINPLFSIALGAFLLNERLTRLQLVAIALATAAVALLTYEAGRLPWVALTLTLSWGFYGYFRKTLPVGPNQGFLLEVLILSPFALAYWGWLVAQGQSHFAWPPARDTLLLMGCGVVTAVPLMIFANGAKRLRLSTIGILQYIAPTMIFLNAVFIFHEPFNSTKAYAFSLIWASLVIYSISLLRGRQNG